jgi:hypothetical protein
MKLAKLKGQTNGKASQEKANKPWQETLPKMRRRDCRSSD